MTTERVQEPLRARALGVELAFGHDLELAGLAPPRDPVDAPVTVIWNDPGAIAEIWAGATPVRTREMRDGDRVLLTVDHDDERGYLLAAPGAGTALVSSDGLQVRCAPDPDGSDWGVLVTGQLLPLVATLRGYEVFHASGVVVDGRSYLISGEPGMGKTSLAAQLLVGGAGLLSDDVVAVDDHLYAHPGTAYLHIRQLERGRLGSSPLPQLREVGPTHGRHSFIAERPADAAPLGAIYILERRVTGPLIEPMPSPDPFRLLGATFNLSVRTAERLRRHLDLCALIAAQIPIFQARIVRGSSATELAAAIRAHIGQIQPTRA